MMLALKIISFIGLVLTLLPSFFVLAGTMDYETYKFYMLAGTILWFTTAPFWIFRKKT